MHKYLLSKLFAVICIAILFVFNGCKKNDIVMAYSFPDVQWIKTKLPDSLSVISLAVSGTNMFAGTLGDGIYRSTDGGITWNAASTGLTNYYVEEILVSDSNIFVGTWGGGVFLSTNNGFSWTSTSQKGTHVSSFAKMGNNLFTGTGLSGIYISNDNGASWNNVIGNGIIASGITALAVSGTDIFAGTSNGVFVSSDSGANWTQVNNGLLYKDITTLTVSDKYIFAGTYSGGIYMSTDKGKNWYHPINGLGGNSNSIVHSFAIYGSTIFVSVSGGVYYSIDEGLNWIDANFYIANELIIVGNNLYAGGIGISYHPL